MKKLLLIVFTAIAMVSSVALAGLIQPVSVEVDLVNGFAQGDMFTARTAMNDVEFIGCGVRDFDDGAGLEYRWGFCQAADADEIQIVCYTESEYLLDTIRASAAYSFITFNWVDDGGAECTRIGFSNQSFYLPKK